MSRIDDLLRNYGRQVALPWERKLAGPQRVWFAVYDKTDERRLRYALGDFEVRTRQEGHGWLLHDVSDAFARWLAGRKYRDSYFKQPEHLHSALPDFRDTVVAGLRAALTHEQADADADAVVAVLGVGCLFGFLRVSELVQGVEADIRGRQRSARTSSLVYQLFEQYRKEGANMPYTMEDFGRDFAKEHLKDLTPEERLEGLSAEERLKGVPAEKRLEGLSPEEIAALLKRYQAGDSSTASE